MIVLETCMIFQFKPHQTTPLPKRMFLQKKFFKLSLLPNGFFGIQQQRQPLPSLLSDSSSKDQTLTANLVGMYCTMYNIEAVDLYLNFSQINTV